MLGLHLRLHTCLGKCRWRPTRLRVIAHFGATRHKPGRRKLRRQADLSGPAAREFLATPHRCIRNELSVNTKRRSHLWVASSAFCRRTAMGSVLRSCFALAILSVLAAHLQQQALAQDRYPYRPIRIIQGFSAGGVSDTLARVIGDKLGERLGQPIVVAAKPGGGGIIGMTTVIEASADGYTLLLGNSAITISPNRKDKPRFDPMKAFVPIAMFGTAPSILLANPTMPVGSMPELIAYAKTMPGKINAATSGIGTTNDLGIHLINQMAGVKIMNIPYKGSGPSLTAALGNETSLSFSPLLPAIPHVQFKRLKALGMSGLKRSPAMPDVPAIAESLPGYDAVGFFGVVAYREVPRPVINLLHKEINTVLALPEVQANLARLGLDLSILSQKEFGDFIAQDARKWADLVRDAKLVF
jgi:tripartite-type tricarboxylate transporter receptor subunit TctC